MTMQDTTTPIGKNADNLSAGADSQSKGKARSTKKVDRAHLISTPGYYRRAWRTLRHDNVAMASLILSVILLIFSFGAPAIASLTGNNYAIGDLTNFLTPWLQSWEHPLVLGN